MEKEAPHEVDGYYYESGEDIDQDASGSYINRKALFQDETTEEYTKNVRLCGFIYHDLVNAISFICSFLKLIHTFSNQTWLGYHLGLR